jgi:hypothetical protein
VEEVAEDREQEFFHRSLRDWSLGLVPWGDEAEQRREEERRQQSRHDDDEEPFTPGHRVPASRKAVEQLSQATWAAAGSGLQTECAVCLKDFEAEDMVSMMPCKHCFHQGCISSGSGSAASAPSAATRCPLLHDDGHRRRRWRLPVISRLTKNTFSME